MTHPESSDETTFEPVTAWHPMLVAVLEKFVPAGWRLLPEFLLRRLPQRIDILVLRQEELAAGTARRLHSIFDHLRAHTIIEHKGPTDDLSAVDALVLLGYAFQYMVLAGVRDPRHVALMVICDSIPAGFVEQLVQHGGQFAPAGAGLWHGEIAGLTLHGVETREAFKAANSERLLYAFTKAYIQNPAALLPPLDEEEERVYLSLYDHVEQFRKRRGPMAMKDEKLAENARDLLISELLSRLTPEQRLAGLAPEQRLAGLAPEQRLAGLAPEQVVKAFSPEQVLNAFPPEQRVASLTPEQRLLALTDDALAAFPDDYLRTLSPETRAAIRRRIGRPAD